VWLVAQTCFDDRPEHELRDGAHLLRYSLRDIGGLDLRRLWRHQSATRRILSYYVPTPVDVLHGHAPLQFQGACSLYPNSSVRYTLHSPVLRELRAATLGEGFGRRLRCSLLSSFASQIERACLLRSSRIRVLSEYSKD